MIATAPGSPAAKHIGTALIGRFAADLAQVWPDFSEPDAVLGVAVSGGPDSLALLLLAHAAIPGRVEAATVDHRLRPESSDEAAMVASVCRNLGVPHEIIPVDVAAGNMQARARTARYHALGDWLARRGLAALATAHHADDQAETLLMRLNRGSGLAGLAGIRARGVVPERDGALVRPLLSWRKAELVEIVADAGLVPAADPSNQDLRFDRARLRAALGHADWADWLDPVAIARSASLLGQAEQALHWATNREWSEAVEPISGGFLYHPCRAGFPVERRLIIINLVGRLLSKLGAKVRESDVATLVDRLLAGQPGNLGGVQARAEGSGPDTIWRFAPENPRR